MNQLAPRKRELAVHKTIHPVVDALSYCARLVNGRPLSASIQEMREQYPERRENINALFGPLEELERRLDTASSHLDASRLRFFFCMLGDHTEQNRSHCPNIASTVFMPSVIAYPHFHDLDSYREELKHYSEAEVIFQARVTFAIPNEGWHIRECSDFSTFYDYIAHFPATDEERYQILGAVRNFPSYVDELTELLRPIVACIQENATLYEPLLNRFGQTYGEIDAEALLKQDARLFEHAAEVIDLYPSLFSINERFTMFYQIENDAPKRNHVEIGVLWDAARAVSQTGHASKRAGFLYEGHRRPGADANPGAPEERGGLCPGVDGENGPVFTTLSHHMTKLMMAGLVTSERRGIYVYYRTNTEFLRWLIAQINHTVLT